MVVTQQNIGALRKLAILVACVLAPIAAAGGPIDVVVGADAYYLNGERAESQTGFVRLLEQNLDEGVLITACQCADTERVDAAIEWLQEMGVRNVDIAQSDEPPAVCTALCG